MNFDSFFSLSGTQVVLDRYFERFSLKCFLILKQNKCRLKLEGAISRLSNNTSLNTDYNECDDFSYDCPVKATCVNNNGSYLCRCDAGYRLDGSGDCEGV